MVTVPRAGAGVTGKWRTVPISETVDEAEAEQDAVHTSVRKGSAQPTEEQVMKHNATPSDWPHSRITHAHVSHGLLQFPRNMDPRRIVGTSREMVERTRGALVSGSTRSGTR